MDRRMYRGNMGNNNGRRVSPYRTSDPVCGDVLGGYRPEDRCDSDDRYDNGFDNNNKRFPIGMCYVPWQRFENLYENEFEALENATLFKDLQFDWYGRGCTNGCK